MQFIGPGQTHSAMVPEDQACLEPLGLKHVPKSSPIQAWRAEAVPIR